MVNSAMSQRVVLMENLSSSEYILREGERPQRVLKDINLQINKAEIWGIIGTSGFEIKLLLEIMANIRPYESGRCVLIERGMMRLKRVILKHIFYIGNSDMLYNTMNVLEFLMLATAKWKMDVVERQEQIFELIIKVGLGHLSLTPIGLLTREEKAVVTLVAAAYSDAQMIVFNLPEYELDSILIEVIAGMSDFIKEQEKTLIVATPICTLIEKACTHIAVLAEGRLIHQGLVEDFRYQYDKVEIIIKDEDLKGTKEALRGILSNHQVVAEDNRLLIKGEASLPSDLEMIYKKIIESGYIPQSMEKNGKTVEYALEEFMRQYDLSE
ncbi:ATP-binding cassette domain-containing protein [Desulfitobacterium chlororespirans]|uniref:ABC-2 type transport system ATP-binding protein n=1 Tax=Desulfitobacterium chlororespirans DSM 11544 TaxID=1121395 RepID=A0A1M7RS32_9FIRM|nr:ATP-binding cassette domain-containing protein [Desulfitobacterium chlororespirans]SHN48926.1 ABC-2 type transport system ATP-binding protein [Desulfitobacterium chlororespirans DSM 11544]